MTRKHSFSDEKLRKAVKSSFSIAEVLRKLKLKAAGGNYETIKNKIKCLKISISHFTGKGHNKGKRLGFQRPISYYLVNGRLTNSNRLRCRLIKEGIFPERCSKCKRLKWCGFKIALELDHINGDKYDNRIENLRILCPNCHALTPTYRGRNMLRARGEMANSWWS